MKISIERVKEIIVEETEELVNELGLCHSDDGTFDDCKKGNVYSLTKKAAEEHGVDKKFSQRGTVSSKEKGKPPKLSAKFGLNTSPTKQGGRKKISGEDIVPKFSVSEYPKKYEEAKSRYDPNWKSSKKRKQDDEMGKPNRKKMGKGAWFHGYDEMDKLARGVGLGLLQDHHFNTKELIEMIDDAFRSLEEERMFEGFDLKSKCRSIGLVSVSEAQQRILRSLNAFSLAQDGKLNAPPDKQ